MKELKTIGVVAIALTSFLLPLNVRKPTSDGIPMPDFKAHQSTVKVVQMRSFELKDPVPISPQDYVKVEARKYGWSEGPEWDALYTLISNESGFRPTAGNPSSAYGMFQFLDSTWASYGCTKTSEPKEQARCGLLYVARRYKTPSNALAVWYSHCPSAQRCWY